MLPHLSLEPGKTETEWHRAVVSEALAITADSVPVRLALAPACEPEQPDPAFPSPGAWRDADRAMAKAAAALEDVRDSDGVLIEVSGPVAPAIESAAFRKAALKRLGARQAFVATAGGRHLRMRDALRANPSADVAALLTGGSLVSDTVWLVDTSGVQAVVYDQELIHITGARTPLSGAVDNRVDPDQIVFARALLAFLAGLGGALLLAGLIARL
ncbi:MAG: hypothetical protein CL927_14725 [Deltaproteobacteria bacterium]|nr:hypothetical protein [Deltaproteobacteria bacterium]